MIRRLTTSTVLCTMLVAGSATLAQNSGGNAPAMGQSETKMSQEANASLKEIMAKAVEAIGGRKAVDKIKTLHTVMGMEMMGAAITMENKWSRDGGRWAKTDSPMGSNVMGTNGETAWMQLPGGNYTIITGPQAEQLDSQASIHMMMLDPQQIRDDMAVLEVAGREEFDGRMANVIRFEPEDSEGEGFMYFDANSGRILGLKQIEQTPMGEQTTTMSLGEWKKVEGVEFFHLLKIQNPSMPGGTMEMAITTLRVNEVEESAFALPEEVQAMVDQAEENVDESETGDAAEGGTADELTLEDLPEAYRERTRQMLTQIKAGGQESIARSLQQFEELMPNLPEGDDKRTLQYIVQELRKNK